MWGLEEGYGEEARVARLSLIFSTSQNDSTFLPAFTHESLAGREDSETSTFHSRPSAEARGFHFTAPGSLAANASYCVGFTWRHPASCIA